jgi:putative glutamine amidotransferase
MRALVAVIGRRAPSVPILRFSATLAAEAICEAVYAAGGEPVVLHGPAADPGHALGARLARFDAVLLPGGADLGPERYGEATAEETFGVDAFQDDFDLACVRAVIAAGPPALAICRGMQVLNVALGGTLHQHLRETTVAHHNALHDVTVRPGSRLRSVVGADLINVSSYHHQAIGRLAPTLVMAAVAADGVIEAVEHPGADILAVQWHPEDLHGTSDTDAALFGDLVERAEKWSTRR